MQQFCRPPVETAQPFQNGLADVSGTEAGHQFTELAGVYFAFPAVQAVAVADTAEAFGQAFLAGGGLASGPGFQCRTQLRVLRTQRRQVRQEYVQVPQPAGCPGMPLELGNGRAQSGGAAYFSNGFGQGPAAAQGNAVLVQEFVIQPEYHARLQLFQALSLKLQGSRKVGNGAWRWSLYRVPVFAFEFPVTVVSGYEKVFQCAGVFIELAPVLTGQANVQEAGGRQGHRRVLRQPVGQFL